MTVYEFNKKIEEFKTKSAWASGVKEYAKELINEWIEGHELDQNYDISSITEKELLRGAPDWEFYSWGGMSLIYNSDICDRLCSKSVQKRKNNGNLKPNKQEDWLDVQARALCQASRLVQQIIHNIMIN